MTSEEIRMNNREMRSIFLNSSYTKKQLLNRIENNIYRGELTITPTMTKKAIISAIIVAEATF